MALFNWNNDYSVNIFRIDEQHKKLIDLINELHTAMLNAKGNAILEEILKGLIDYTDYHFKTEELLMQNYNFPYFLEHKQNHKILTDKVIEFYEEFKLGKKLLTVELLFFLKNWISDHIIKEDKMYSKFLNERGVD